MKSSLRKDEKRENSKKVGFDATCNTQINDEDDDDSEKEDEEKFEGPPVTIANWISLAMIFMI